MGFATVSGRLAVCAVSSVVEHFPDTEGVTGSNPVSRTINAAGSSVGGGRDSGTNGWMYYPNTARHGGAANFAFCDGHVSRFETNALRYPNPAGDPRFER